MEPTREPPVQPYTQPYTAQPYPQATPARKPSPFTVFGRFMRLLLRRFVYGLVVIFQPFRRHLISSLLVLALLGLVGWMGFQLWGPHFAAPADPRAASLPPAPAVENYLTGRQSYNADLMWEAFSNTYQASQLQNGGSKATLQSIAGQEKQLGLQYRKLQYIGGVKLEDGGSMYYYSVDLAIQSRKARLPIVFMADKDGKIEYIISPIDDIVKSLTN
jgi:hypothetical protein